MTMHTDTDVQTKATYIVNRDETDPEIYFIHDDYRYLLISYIAIVTTWNDSAATDPDERAGSFCDLLITGIRVTKSGAVDRRVNYPQSFTQCEEMQFTDSYARNGDVWDDLVKVNNDYYHAKMHAIMQTGADREVANNYARSLRDRVAETVASIAR